MFEELAFHRTSLGELVLRRRRVPGLGNREIYEVKLNDDLLMSSLLTESERALAGLSLAATAADEIHVLVGGLGLGYTAKAALENDRVASVTVVELLPEIIGWHRDGMGPLGDSLFQDPRCRILPGNFFEALADPEPLVRPNGDHSCGAILVDIDHAPDSWLHADHEDFYKEVGLARAAALLAPGGVFGFWSSGRSDEGFLAALRAVFHRVEPHGIEVRNPLVDELQVDTVYVADRPVRPSHASGL